MTLLEPVTLIDKTAEPNPEFEVKEPPPTTETLDLVNPTTSTAELQTVNRARLPGPIGYRRSAPPMPATAHHAQGPVLPRPRRDLLLITASTVGLLISTGVSTLLVLTLSYA